ncbi:MAG: hypothetical protein K2X82_26615 [Gemmataceae bacterium]|nr:hypothetical protein [Gemmataceae bacterium]
MTGVGLLVLANWTVLTWGYEIDCRSWPGKEWASVAIHLTAADGAELVIVFDIPADATPLDIQALIVVPSEHGDWVVRAGPKDTVRIFAPGGKTVGSIGFESDTWIPACRRVPGLPAPKPKKK